MNVDNGTIFLKQLELTAVHSFHYPNLNILICLLALLSCDNWIYNSFVCVVTISVLFPYRSFNNSSVWVLLLLVKEKHLLLQLLRFEGNFSDK